jgi:hypothetical protein
MREKLKGMRAEIEGNATKLDGWKTGRREGQGRRREQGNGHPQTGMAEGKAKGKVMTEGTGFFKIVLIVILR